MPTGPRPRNQAPKTTSPKPQPALGQAIAELRYESDLTQEQLAARAGLHPTNISAIENGRTNPNWSTVLAIAGGLDTPISQIALRAEQIVGSGPATIGS